MKQPHLFSNQIEPEMQNFRTIFVAGATGNQGSAAVTSLLHHGFRVKGLSRNINTAKAARLKHPNLEWVEGNLDKPATFKEHLKNTDGIFCVLGMEKDVNKEVRRGIALINLALEYKIAYFVYSSVIGADAHTGIPNWESKYKIENHLRQSGIPFTIIQPASFFENFLFPQVRKGVYKGKLMTPVSHDKVQQFITTEDIGKIVSQIFMNPAACKDRTIIAATEQMDMDTVARIFSSVLGKEIKYQQLPAFLVRIFLGKNLYTMFKWVNENDAIFQKDLDSFKKEFPDLTSLSDWIRKHF